VRLLDQPTRPTLGEVQVIYDVVHGLRFIANRRKEISALKH